MRFSPITIQPAEATAKPSRSVSRQIPPRQTVRLAMAGAAILGCATAGHAQYVASLYSSSSSTTGGNITQQGNNLVGPLITSEIDVPCSSYSIANYGLLGGNDSGSSSATGPDQDVGGDTTVDFSDLIPISSPSKPMNAIIPYTVNLALFGSYAVSAELTALGGEYAFVDVQVAFSTTNFNGTDAGISGSYGFYDNDDSGAETIQHNGATSFSGTAQNNTTLYFYGEMTVEATGSYGGSASADYGSTGVFNLESSVSDVQFIGSQGTNYGTLSDTGGAAAAPEPGTLGLIVPALGVLGVGACRRRRS